MSKGILIKDIGVTGSDPFPCVDGLTQIYMQKNMNTVFVSLGASSSCLADLEIAEPFGCPIFVTPIGATHADKWAEVARVLKAHKREPENSVYPFSEQAESKWILSKNVRMQEALPWWTTGEIDISGQKIKTQDFLEWTTSICSTMKLRGDVRIDIIKVDLPYELERGVLMSMLNAGLRPGFIMVKWDKKPNDNVPTTLTAGHLQNCGYYLIGKTDNKFLYYYTDNDLYMSCEWEDMTTQNPIITTIIDKIKNSKVTALGPNDRSTVPLPSDTKAGTATESNAIEEESQSLQ
jgi:hypothetical protein